MQASADSFTVEGFNNWRKKALFDKHVGDHNSAHNRCRKACEDLMNQKQHIEVALSNQSDQARTDYRTRLTASIKCIKFLLKQGLALRGHDESEESRNRGNFIELLEFLAENNEATRKVILSNAPENLKLISPMIQNDIISSFASETTEAIISEIGDKSFSLLVDEARDMSVKEQMAVVLRFVDDKGFVVERFLGLVHVKSTTSLALKEGIEYIFSKHGLSISSLRGQGYDGASNMRGEFNGLKSLILAENSSAYYVHCFAHQLQLILVAVVQNHPTLGTFFDYIRVLTNIVGGSSKRRDILREKQLEKVVTGIASGEISTGHGLNQEQTLKRPGDTRWSSHYGTIVSLKVMFSSVIDVLIVIAKDGQDSDQRNQAFATMKHIQCFEFVFLVHLMQNVLGITHELSQALQKKDQEILNAMKLVKATKSRLQNFREDGWDSMLNDVCMFCVKEDLNIVAMEDTFVPEGRSRRNSEVKTNLHYYRVELFCTVIDRMLAELDGRFNEMNMELLSCVACLDPRDSFSAFDTRKLIRLAEFYPSDFSPFDLEFLKQQLDTYIVEMRSDDSLNEISGIGDLCRKMIQLRKHNIYPMVFKLIKLALLLPVATATVERVFSAMKIIKSQLRNRLGDDLMNNCLITYIEKDLFESVDIEDVIQRFQNMKARRGSL